ncbi:MAG: DNA adenine methylase [Rickettsiales bacterium]|jgi:DNA adenine methylase|nr:DNA adenine methylase [Rickettsiales bacterium]
MTRKNIYSPLRYPGGKAKILNFIKEIIKDNYFGKKPAYIEPYAGGAAIAIGLLLDGYVSKVYINDFDPAIYSFWYCVKNHPKEFINKIKDTEITIEEWHKQKDIYKKGKEEFNLGFSTFFLNRCNRSGVIEGGCIGGLRQMGNYKIDCRFNKKDLIERIEKISRFSDKINISNEDTLEFLREKNIQNILSKNCLLYIDPPYYKNGKQLYKNYYKYTDHRNISELVKKLDTKWIVSYDNVAEIQELYDGCNSKEFNLTYFAGKVKVGKEIMFFSDKISYIPDLIFM